MEKKKIKLLDIAPADYNPRKISDSDLRKLRGSIDEFGLVDPIIVNLDNNRIIGGHQRYDVLRQNGVEDAFMVELGGIGWVFLEDDLKIKSKSHEKALNIALNKISGDWDRNKLSEVLNELSLVGFEMELTGFEENEWLENESVDFAVDEDEDFDGEVNDADSEPYVEDEISYDLVITFGSEEELERAFEKFSDLGIKCRTIVA